MRNVINDGHVVEVLDLWRFHKNKTRANVRSEEQEWVYSDTLGIARSRDGRLVRTKPTRDYPQFMELLCRWLRDGGPSFMRQPFPFTSIALNYDFAAQLHRAKGSAWRGKRYTAGSAAANVLRCAVMQ